MNLKWGKYDLKNACCKFCGIVIGIFTFMTFNVSTAHTNYNKYFSAGGIITISSSLSTNINQTQFRIESDGLSWRMVTYEHGILSTNTYAHNEDTVYLYTITPGVPTPPVATLTRIYEPTGDTTSRHLLWFVYLSGFDKSVGDSHKISAPFMLYMNEAYLYDNKIERHDLWPYSPVFSSFILNESAYRKEIYRLEENIKKSVTDEELRGFQLKTQYLHSLCAHIPAVLKLKELTASNDIAIPIRWEIYRPIYVDNFLRKYHYRGEVTNVSLGNPDKIDPPTPFPGTRVADARKGNHYFYLCTTNWLSISELEKNAKLITPNLESPKKWYQTATAYKIARFVPSGIVILAFLLPLIFIAKTTRGKKVRP